MRPKRGRKKKKTTPEDPSGAPPYGSLVEGRCPSSLLFTRKPEAQRMWGSLGGSPACGRAQARGLTPSALPPPVTQALPWVEEACRPDIFVHLGLIDNRVQRPSASFLSFPLFLAPFLPRSQGSPSVPSQSPPPSISGYSWSSENS